VNNKKNDIKKNNTPEIIFLSCSINLSHSGYRDFAASCACEIVLNSHLLRIQISNKKKTKRLFLFFFEVEEEDDK
jgi:hypothetical protein